MFYKYGHLPEERVTDGLQTKFTAYIEDNFLSKLVIPQYYQKPLVDFRITDNVKQAYKQLKIAYEKLSNESVIIIKQYPIRKLTLDNGYYTYFG